MQIAILGGGIGGLSTAIALLQAGFKVSIYERHSSPTDIGAGIVCWPNASFILDKLGVLEQVAQVSGTLLHMHRFSNTNQSLGSLDIRQLSRQMGYPSYSVLRKDLLKILTLRCLALNGNIAYQHNVTAISEYAPAKASVQFANGLTIQADVIIGADGRMNSLSRQYVNHHNAPIYQGFINWIGVYSSQTALFSELSVSDYWGIGERFGIVPVSENVAYWAGGVAAANIEEKHPDLYKRELNSLFADWPEPITQLINGTAQKNINKIYVHDHNPITTWHKGNLVLLGDSAHSPLPTSGQGACQALEDAWHIANCLTEHSANIDRAFSQFTELRQAKTTAITMAGRQLASSIFNRDPLFCQQRNTASKNSDFSQLITGMAKGWSSGLPLSV